MRNLNPGHISKTKLALDEKSEAFLERAFSDVRKEIQAEIGELLPPTFRSVVWGSPLPLVQESIIKCPGKMIVLSKSVCQSLKIIPMAILKTLSVFGTLCY